MRIPQRLIKFIIVSAAITISAETFAQACPVEQPDGKHGSIEHHAFPPPLPHYMLSSVPRIDGHEPTPPFLAGIDLSEAQRDKIFAITYAIMPSMREQEKLARHARIQLMDLGISGQYSEAKAKELANTIGKAEAELILLRTLSDSQIYELLNDEQRRELADRKSKCDMAMKGHMKPSENGMNK
jgi:protein CpxP